MEYKESYFLDIGILLKESNLFLYQITEHQICKAKPVKIMKDIARNIVTLDLVHEYQFMIE